MRMLLIEKTFSYLMHIHSSNFITIVKREKNNNNIEMLSAFYNTAFCKKINRFYFDFIYYFSEYCGYVNANIQQTPLK